MKNLAFLIGNLSFLACSLSPQPITSVEYSDQRLKMLYNSLDPYSISQHLAFYELYRQKPLGQQALRDVWELLYGRKTTFQAGIIDIPFSTSVISSLVSLVNKSTDQELPLINEEDLQTIENLSFRLAHIQFKGHYAKTEEEVLQLPPEEIDLARGLFLSQFGPDLQKIRTYEAIIDLMALQILNRLPAQATPEIKIRLMNWFIFEEMGFRFPPHSLYAKDIDLYTFLPSVLDSHQGVCLGVSILYLCLAQRLALPLEMITPPGHIYVRYRSSETIINIETTARGIHLDSEEYLGVDTRSLQQRNIKEVIGLAHFNQAAVFLQQEEYIKALAAYQKAEAYLPGDYLVKELLGYSYLLVGNQQMGVYLLQQVKDHIPDYAIVKDTMAEDYLQGKVDIESFKVIFKRVDEDRQSVLNKKQLLEGILQRHPYFRAGVLHLAITWLQLHRAREALETLNSYYTLHPNDPEVNYYLAVLYGQRYDYNKAWEHLRQAERIVHERNYNPKILKELRKSLAICCPE
jgi:regulator of sirC expression with transglutaminase-like and TPR domain